MTSEGNVERDRTPFVRNLRMDDPELDDAYFLANADKRPAFAVGRKGFIATSTDAGEHWVTAASVETSEDLWGAFFFNFHWGWAVGDGGTIVATRDGGRTWKTQSSGLRDRLTRVAFATEHLGFIWGSSGTALTTTDGGAHWVRSDAQMAAGSEPM